MSKLLLSSLCRYSLRILVASAASRMEIPLRLRASSSRSPLVCMAVRYAIYMWRGRPIFATSPWSGAIVPGRRSLEFFQVGQYFARLGAIFRSHDTLFLHQLHDPGGAIVADAQAALEHRGGGAAGGFEDFHRLVVQFLVVAHFALVVVFLVPVLLLAGLLIDVRLHLLRIDRRTVPLEEGDDLGDLLVGHHGA